MRWAVIMAVAWLLAGCGEEERATTTTVAARAGCVPPAPGTYRVPVQDGRVPVLLHVPPSAPRGRRPVVVHLPGAGQDGAFAEAYTGESALADRQGFLVAYPTAAGTSPFWNVSGHVAGKPDDVTYLRAVIARLVGDGICADPDRVYVTGASNGGGMTARMACEAADLLAAAAPVAGGYKSLPRCRSRRPLPLLEIHSRADPVVPYNNVVKRFIAGWRARNGTRAPVRHVVIARAPHGWYAGSTERTWAFLKRFTRRGPA